jgi:hypothetical protein
MPETIPSRPLPKRPDNGLLAWEATIGYLSTQYSLDATLVVRAYPAGTGTVWGATAAWGQHGEHISDQASLAAALRELWRQVDRNHVIFEQREAVIKRPANYSDNQWIDNDTQVILERVIQVTRVVYGADWQLAWIYQPVEKPELRFLARLTAQGQAVSTSGQGRSMGDASRDLYRNAAHHFVADSGKELDDTMKL